MDSIDMDGKVIRGKLSLEMESEHAEDISHYLNGTSDEGIYFVKKGKNSSSIYSFRIEED